MIGTREHAATIATMPLREDNNDDWSGPVPEGFTYLGSGAYRHAFLGPDGVVYKRHVNDGQDDGGGNLTEWARYQMECPKGVRFARTHLFNIGDIPIIAMEYVDEKSPKLLDEAIRKALNTLGIWDYYGNNVRFRDGEVILTDFAC